MRCFLRRPFRRILIINSDYILSTTMVIKVDAHLLPWSFWKCQWRHWFSMVSFCLQHVVHVVTISSICLLRPGHHTESRTLSRNLRLPSCPAWILSRMSNRIYVGMMIVWSFRKTCLDSNSSPLGPIWFQWGVQFWFIWPAFGTEFKQIPAYFIILLVKS